jgi:hypothetical protein
MQPVSDDVQFTAPHNPRRDRRVLILAWLAGFALAVIGVRFYIWPEAASRFFGLIGRPTGYQLHTAIGLRDMWLAAVLLATVALGEWRLLAVWLGFGAMVCFGDAGIVFGANGRPLAILFHLFSGVFMTVLAVLAWRRARRDHPPV